jgi:hypothetical protein
MKRLIACCIILSGCASDRGSRPGFAQIKAQAKSVCEIMNEPGAHLGKRVTVLGTYWNTPHARVLAGDGCDWSFRVALREYDKRTEPRHRMEVVYSGVLRSEPVVIPCSDPECFRYSLEDSELLAAPYRNDRVTILRSRSVPLCNMIGHPDIGVGGRIMVSGTHALDPHHRYLSDPDCPQWQLEINGAPGIRDDAGAKRVLRDVARSDPRVRAPVVYSGIFRATPLIAGCAKPSCFTYSLKEARLLAASPPRE